MPHTFRRRLALLFAVSVGCTDAAQKVAIGVDSGADGAAPPDAGDAALATPDSAPDGVAVDAANDQSAAPDSPPAACAPGAPFGTPVAVAGGINTPGTEGGPRLTSDELTMYFSRAPMVDGSLGTSGLFVAHRSSTSAPWDSPTPLATLNGSFDEYDPTTSNELRIFFTRNDRPANFPTMGDIWAATRASTADPFGTPSAVASVNSGSGNTTSFLTADSAELWFASNRPGGPGGYDIYRAPASATSFAAPVLVPEVSSGSTEFAPMVSSNGLVIFFSSDRDGGAGSQDIWVGSRATVSDSFSGIENLAAVNSGKDDYPGWLSTDGCRLYMSSLRSGQEDIYVATRGQ